MTKLSLVKTRIRDGVWEGVLSGTAGEAPPALRCVHAGRAIDGIEVAAADGAAGQWSLRIPIPAEALNDGIEAFLIQDAASGETLGQFAVLAGDSVEADVRAELALLREELDMLKRAFRRHCVETG